MILSEGKTLHQHRSCGHDWTIFMGVVEADGGGCHYWLAHDHERGYLYMTFTALEFGQICYTKMWIESLRDGIDCMIINWDDEEKANKPMDVPGIILNKKQVMALPDADRDYLWMMTDYIFDHDSRLGKWKHEAMSTIQ